MLYYPMPYEWINWAWGTHPERPPLAIPDALYPVFGVT